MAPLAVIGNVLYHARQHAGSAGITVTAASAADGNVIWQSDLATPTVALVPQPEARSVEAISAHGNVYPINKEAIDAKFAGKPVEPLGAADRASAYAQAHPLEGGRIALVSQTQPENVLLYEPGKGPPQVVRHKTDHGAITTPPVPLKLGEMPTGLVMASAGGRVSLVDPKSGDDLLLPFQPPVDPGAKVQWLAPALLAGRGEVVIAGSQRKIFRVGRKDDPQPHLAELATRALDAPLAERLAAAGEAVYGVERGGREDVAVVFALPNLDFKKKALKGRVVWGPEQVGDVVLVVSTGDGLMCFDGREEPRWTHADIREKLAASPLAQNGQILLATQTGQLARLSTETGEATGQASVGAPLASGPTLFISSLLFGGNDGAVYVLPALE
jgi:outer membrane protein assembly factor BamB